MVLPVKESESVRSQQSMQSVVWAVDESESVNESAVISQRVNGLASRGVRVSEKSEVDAVSGLGSRGIRVSQRVSSQQSTSQWSCQSRSQSQ